MFPSTTDAAFYDAEKNRITPWFPANARYVADEATAGAAVCYAGLRDFDYFELFHCPMTLVEGARHRVVTTLEEDVTVESTGDEFLDMVTLWLKRRKVKPPVQRALSVMPDEETTGGDFTGYETELVARITYRSDTGKILTITEWVEYANFIKQLEQLAINEERRRPRLQMFRDLKATLPLLPDMPNIVFRLLSDLTFPGRGGVTVTVQAGDTVDYIPAVSVKWLIEQGHVKPMCASADDGCAWCKLAAQTREDPGWLKLYGWCDPFEA